MKTGRSTCRLRAVLLVTLLGWCSSTIAHSMHQSALLLDYHAQTVEAELQLPVSRLGQVFGRALTSENISSCSAELAKYVLLRVHVRTPRHVLWTLSLQTPLTWDNLDGAPYVVAHLLMTPPQGSSVRELVIEDDVIKDTLASQVVLVSVRSDWASSTFANDPELIGVLNGEERFLQIDRRSGEWTRGFLSVFRLGVRHIAEGTDHLLFLLALLLPAPLLYEEDRWAEFAGIRHAFTQILKVVTAFTIGHSLTLALAASGLVHVPGRPIEVLIAISILISAIHAIRPVFPGREAFVAGSFGLVHGLAFASTLAELGLRTWERVASIFAFNVGIETMQLLVVLCIMPSLVLMSRTSFYTPFRMMGASFAGVAALGWVFERTSYHALAVDHVVDVFARHSTILAGSLFCVSCLAYWSQRHSRPARPG